MSERVSTEVNPPGDWCASPPVFKCATADIHVWRINLTGFESQAARLNTWLDDAECQRAAGYRFDPDRSRFVIRRGLLRYLLAAYLETTPEVIRLPTGLHGKPAIGGQEAPGGLRFNCSHSANWALIAIASGRELGADVEQHRPITEMDDLAKDIFSEREIKEWQALPASLRTPGFFNGWTRKEAFVKALGTGLSYPLDGFSVSLTPGRSPALLEVSDDSEGLIKWSLASLEVAPDYSAALVHKSGPGSLRLFDGNNLLS
jgi:4'-phosphopantetheinyl transferase